MSVKKPLGRSNRGGDSFRSDIEGELARDRAGGRKEKAETSLQISALFGSDRQFRNVSLRRGACANV
jgi:hypothetical protein